MSTSSSIKEEISLKKFKEKVLNDFRTICLSREISILGRREVLLGRGNLEFLVMEKNYLKLS